MGFLHDQYYRMGINNYNDYNREYFDEIEYRIRRELEYRIREDVECKIREEYSLTDREILDRMDISFIERYLRERKLKRISGKNRE